MMAILALEDGRVFEGEAFGARKTITGEVCFNTSMCGYQEVLTDPSYRGQMVAMTYPHIGNYGINTLDQESDEPHVRGFIIEELSEITSNWRSECSLEEYLIKYNIPGIQGVDTRALTKHLRTRGSLRGCLSSEGISPEEAIKRAKESEGVVGMDFVQEVTPKAAYEWDPDGSLSCDWAVEESSREDAVKDGLGNVQLPIPAAKHRIVAYDFGMKRNILRNLRQNGFQVQVVPAKTTAEEVLALNPDGVFLSNGPGDPSALEYAHTAVRELVKHKPVFGICLGHQILGYAFGGKTFKLKFGHRGGNQPVKDLRTGKVTITSQNHGFAIDPESLPSEVEVTHINLNDGTVAGMAHRKLPVFSVQYHPEAAPGPHDAHYFFEEFSQLIERQKGAIV
ncbi:MAG: glutamine-hydrolyzing carbamoyl-phosphate synthase small subunit [Chthoniobacterales bacterium]